MSSANLSCLKTQSIQYSCNLLIGFVSVRFVNTHQLTYILGLSYPPVPLQAVVKYALFSLQE